MKDATPPTPENQHVPCPACAGRTIVFAGKGKESLYRICPLWELPGHLTKEQVEERFNEHRRHENPSGRFG